MEKVHSGVGRGAHGGVRWLGRLFPVDAVVAFLYWHRSRGVSWHHVRQRRIGSYILLSRDACISPDWQTCFLYKEQDPIPFLKELTKRDSMMDIAADFALLRLRVSE